MGWWNHMDETDTSRYTMDCPECHKKMEVVATDQTSGFRETSTLYCPWCKAKIYSSREVDYFAKPIRTIEVINND